MTSGRLFINISAKTDSHDLNKYLFAFNRVENAITSDSDSTVRDCPLQWHGARAIRVFLEFFQRVC